MIISTETSEDVDIGAWSGTCLERADRRAAKFLLLALSCLLAVVIIGVPWLVVLSVPVVIELAAPGLRHLISRRRIRRMMTGDWRPVIVRFAPGRRIGRSAYLEMAGLDRSYLRLPEMPERVRVLVRYSRRVWMTGPDDRGRAVVITGGRPFLTLGRIVVR